MARYQALFFNKLLTLFHIAFYSSINLLSLVMKDITLVSSKYFSFMKIFDIRTHLRELFTSWYDTIITFLSKEVFKRAFFLLYGYLSNIPILLMSTLSILIGCLRLWNKFYRSLYHQKSNFFWWSFILYKQKIIFFE